MQVRVGNARDIAPGHVRAYVVDLERIAVANVEGRFYAFGDTCTHEGCSLATGRLEGTIVQCPCHGSRFDIGTGAVVRGPAERPVKVVGLTDRNGELSIER